MTTEKFLCIHGHFYQPPRENPWLESVELQDSAAPYHDWNERITAECYAPNASARILDSENRIAQIVSNYSKISFNFGPTLLTWMKDKTPAIHDAIVEADKLSRKQFSGHGSALAQVYNHIILPLANRRDKFTQVLWGIRDFEARFGRKPEGLWLSETAVDSESLDVLAELGIKFTILSPHQAARCRKLGEKEWQDCNGGIDPTRPYLAKLKSGREMNLFFYDNPVSKAVAFEHVLTSGEQFASRLMSAFSDKRDWDQLVHVATDGESYGHHHRFGDMALAYALHHVETHKLARLTNYGEFLETHPPTHEVQIHENSAWSCVHGVGRWAENCGCNSGSFAGWNQNWRAPLRESLNWLRDQLAPLFEKKAAEFFKDPWAARDDYIFVVLDRSPKNLEKFFREHTNEYPFPLPATKERGEGQGEGRLQKSSSSPQPSPPLHGGEGEVQHSPRGLTDAEKILALKLLEIQRHAMLMFTSCGWFFDELSGIETVQVIQYAARAIQLAKEVFQKDLEAEFLDLLEKAKSNIPEHADGRVIYGKFVKPAMVDFEKVVAHYAVSSVFETYSDRTKIFLYSFEDEKRELDSAGRARLGIGTTKVAFDITRESATLSFAVIYMGEHNLTGGVRAFASTKQREKMAADLKESFQRADFPETIRRLDHHFGGATYSLKSLFKDEQRKILDQILVSTRQDLEEHFRNIAERYTPLMRFLRDIGAPLLPAMRHASDFILHVDICREFDSDAPDFDELRSLIEEARARNVNVFDTDLAFVIKSRMEAMIERLAAKPDDLPLLQNLIGIAAVAKPLPLELNLWKVQNTYWEMLQRIFPKVRAKAKQDDEQAREWVEELFSLGEQLGFAVKNLRDTP